MRTVRSLSGRALDDLWTRIRMRIGHDAFENDNQRKAANRMLDKIEAEQDRRAIKRHFPHRALP